MSFLEEKFYFLPPWSRVLIMTSPLSLYHFGVKLQSITLNLVKKKYLRDRYHLQNGSFPKSAVWISKHFGKIIKDQSKIILQVIFHINGDFNNSRK